MSELSEFVLARLDEREALALAATPGPWRHAGKNCIETPGIDVTEANWGRYEDDGATLLHDYRIHCARDRGAWKEEDAAHIAANHPKVVLDEIGAHRTIVYMFEKVERASVLLPLTNGMTNDATNDILVGLKAALICLAVPYATHPDFKEVWLP